MKRRRLILRLLRAPREGRIALVTLKWLASSLDNCSMASSSPPPPHHPPLSNPPLFRLCTILFPALLLNHHKASLCPSSLPSLSSSSPLSPPLSPGVLRKGAAAITWLAVLFLFMSMLSVTYYSHAFPHKII